MPIPGRPPSIRDALAALERSCNFDPKQYNAGRGFDFSPQATLLHTALAAAVPLHVAELLQRERELDANAFWEELRDSANAGARLLGESGDALMFRVKGKTAEAFNALARGLACLAFCPSGVTFLGTRWEVPTGGNRKPTAAPAPASLFDK